MTTCMMVYFNVAISHIFLILALFYFNYLFVYASPYPWQHVMLLNLYEITVMIIMTAHFLFMLGHLQLLYAQICKFVLHALQWFMSKHVCLMGKPLLLYAQCLVGYYCYVCDWLILCLYTCNSRCIHWLV